jgi:hypothetical protein
MRLDRYAVFQEQIWGCFAKVCKRKHAIKKKKHFP